MADVQSQKLRDYVLGIMSYTNISEHNTPIVVRKTNPTILKTTTIVASKTEPHEMQLPLNVLWIQFDSSRADYLTMYRRESKATPSSGTFNHTWNKVTTFDELWDEQFWDPQDDILPNTEEANSGMLGTVRLTVTSTNPGDPVVITEGDPTLSDSRNPLPHDEMHDEVPATRLATTGRAVVISNGAPVEGGTALADFLGDSAWNGLTTNQIYPAVTELDKDNPSRADSLAGYSIVSADIVLA